MLVGNCFYHRRIIAHDDLSQRRSNGTTVAKLRAFYHRDGSGWPTCRTRCRGDGTYRARDTVLHSAVALKIINGSVAHCPAAKERFLREARAAARLRHPNIASVSHYGEEGGRCYYAMELVEGETLDARVRREGPFPAAMALEIGIQVARALAAAEASGVVHRDLKPSNLMLTEHADQNGSNEECFTVKVIDWGLAKAAGDDPILGADHTRGSFVGTPAFASPEQFARQENQRVDTRSDIYSLGVTLWYLICVCTPFVGDTLEVILTQQQEISFKQLTSRHVPKPLVKVLKAMLALDPADRPQSARELLDALRRCQEQLTAKGRTAERGIKGRWLAAGLGVLVILAVGLGGWWHLFRAKSPVLDCSVAVLPFEDLSPNKSDAPFTMGVQDAIAKDLARVATLRVVGVGSMPSTASKPLDFSRFGQELGVHYLLAGSVVRQGKQVHLKVDLLDVHGGTHRWSTRYDRSLNDVFAIQSEITQSVAGCLGITLSAAEKADVVELPTSDIAAYDFYLQVHENEHLFQSEAESNRYYVQVGIPLLEEAVARDPKFALAYCDLTAAHDALIECKPAVMQAEVEAEHRRQAEAALAIACRLQPDSGEIYLAKARHLIRISRFGEEARIELNLARRRLPDNAEVEMLAGEIAFNENRWEEAIHCFERAGCLDPRSNRVSGYLINLYRSLRRYRDADRMYARIIANMALEDTVAFRLGRTLSSIEEQANLAPLRKTIIDITTIEQPQAEVVNRYALLLALFEHDPEAVSKLLAATTETHFKVGGVSYPKAWFAALVAQMHGDSATAKAAFRLARSEVNEEMQIDPKNGRTLGLLAMIDAGLGFKDEAMREAMHASELCPVETSGDQAPVVACELAVVYAWTGQPDLACDVLEQWIVRPAGYNLPGQPTYGDFRLNPLWDALRGYTRFDALVARLAPAGSR